MQLSIHHGFHKEPQILTDIDFFMSPSSVCKPECARKLVADFAESFHGCRTFLDDVFDRNAGAFCNIYALNLRESIFCASDAATYLDPEIVLLQVKIACNVSASCTPSIIEPGLLLGCLHLWRELVLPLE